MNLISSLAFESTQLTVMAVSGILALVVSAMSAWLMVITSRFHIHWTADHPSTGPQKLHTQSTARVGGIAIALGLTAGLISLHTSAPMELRTELQSYRAAWLVAAATPLFLLGLAEDLSSAMSIRLRLLAALAAGAVAWIWGEARIYQLHLPLVDQWLASVPLISFFLTLVAVGGLVHAMNIIDGVNGLLAGVAMLMFAAIAWVASRCGEPGLMAVSLLCIAAVAGFGLFNFPKALIFCGDAGAYLIGYVVAILLVLLVLNQPAISPWFAMTVVIHPVTETLYSAWRRAKLGLSPTNPDASHLHSLWSSELRRYEEANGTKVFLGTNAGASWRTLAMVLVPTVFAALLPNETILLQTVCAAYVVSFILMVRYLASKASKKSTSNKPPGTNQVVNTRMELEKTTGP